jgi:hypothetical protein
MDWILGVGSDNQNAVVLWFYGPDGAGKSVIAHNIAERCDLENLLLASFFFSRSDPTRCNVKSLIATISYQIAINIPETRQNIFAAIERDPLVLNRSLEAQLSALVVYPLRELLEEGYFNTSPSRRLIIIDGLDECDTPATQSKVLDVMSLLFHKHHLPLLLLVTSRPERHLNHSFNSGSLSEFRATLALDDTYKPDDDVRPFLTDSFKQVQDTHSMRHYLDSSWPSDDDELEGLGEKSSEQFIRGKTHKVIANNQTPRILEVPKGHMTYEMGTSFPSVFSIPEHLK